MRLFNFYIDRDDFERLAAIGGRRGIATLVRQAIQEWVERHGHRIAA